MCSGFGNNYGNKKRYSPIGSWTTCKLGSGHIRESDLLLWWWSSFRYSTNYNSVTRHDLPKQKETLLNETKIHSFIFFSVCANNKRAKGGKGRKRSSSFVCLLLVCCHVFPMKHKKKNWFQFQLLAC